MLALVFVNALPIAYCLLHIAYCLLHIAYYILPIAYCLLHIAYYCNTYYYVELGMIWLKVLDVLCELKRSNVGR